MADGNSVTYLISCRSPDKSKQPSLKKNTGPYKPFHSLTSHGAHTTHWQIRAKISKEKQATNSKNNLVQRLSKNQTSFTPENPYQNPPQYPCSNIPMAIIPPYHPQPTSIDEQRLIDTMCTRP